MNFKTSLLAAILSGVAFLPKLSIAETSSSPHSGPASTQQNQKAPEKPDSALPSPVVALQGPALFQRLDTDKDGRISLAEFVAYGKAADSSTGSEKKTSVENSHSDSSSGASSGKVSDPDQSRRIKHDPPDPTASPAAQPSTAVPKPPSPGPSMLPSASTRASKYTAEVFEILDINHDKFLNQSELDALVGAHQISQP